MSEPQEFAGLLRRDAGGFVLNGVDGQTYRLELLRTPVDLVEKQVIVVGALLPGSVIETIAVRAAPLIE